MEMNVINFLTPSATNMEFQLIAFESQFFCNFFRIPDQMSHEFLIGFFHGHHGVDMLSWDHKDVVPRLRVNIMKTHGLRTFIDHFGGDFLGDDFAEKAVVHEEC